MDELFGKDPDAAGVVIDASGLPDRMPRQCNMHACAYARHAGLMPVLQTRRPQYQAIVLPELTVKRPRTSEPVAYL